VTTIESDEFRNKVIGILTPKGGGWGGIVFVCDDWFVYTLIEYVKIKIERERERERGEGVVIVINDIPVFGNTL
jgi:hypothetical protein